MYHVTQLPRLNSSRLPATKRSKESRSRKTGGFRRCLLNYRPSSLVSDGNVLAGHVLGIKDSLDKPRKRKLNLYRRQPYRIKERRSFPWFSERAPRALFTVLGCCCRSMLCVRRRTKAWRREVAASRRVVISCLL